MKVPAFVKKWICLCWMDKIGIHCPKKIQTVNMKQGSVLTL